MAALKNVRRGAAAEAPAPAVGEPKAGEVTDGLGRKIILREPDLLDELTLLEICGEAASNQRYMEMVTPLIYIANFDGDVVAQPSSKGELDLLAKRVGKVGYTAIMAWYFPNVLQPVIDAMKDAGKAAARVKN